MGFSVVANCEFIVMNYFLFFWVYSATKQIVFKPPQKNSAGLTAQAKLKPKL